MCFAVVGKNLAIGRDGDGGIVSEDLGRGARTVGGLRWRVKFRVANGHYAIVLRGYGFGPGGGKAGASRLEMW